MQDDNNDNSANDDMEIVRKNKRNTMEEEDQSSRRTDLEDIMSLIINKMDALTTSSEDVSKDEIIAIFMTVLECTDGEAVFYLESTNWNIEMAAQLKLEDENENFYNSKRGRTFGSQQFIDPVFQEHNGLQRYLPREVNIEGLPEGWKAVVSRRTGTIYFVNDIFNIRQSHVPPGFADITPPPILDFQNGLQNGKEMIMEEQQPKKDGDDEEI